MKIPSTSMPRIVALAQCIQDDIQQRRLAPGDAYSGTGKTARKLGVSTQAANRAMQLLVKRNVLERSQGRGTYIANPGGERATMLQCVHLLVREDYLRTEGLLADGVVLGIQAELPGAQMQFNFLPKGGEDAFVDDLIVRCLEARGAEGFVLVRSSLASQRLLAASGLPAVVHGTLYPSVTGLAMVDRDNRQVGRVLAEYLLTRGHKRVLLLMRQQMLHGDTLALDAMLEALGRGGLGLGDIMLRFLPNDPEAAWGAARQWLESHGDSPGVICRSIVFAAAAARAARDLGLSGPDDVTIAVADYYHKAGERPGYPCTYATLTPEEQGRHIGRLLRAQARGVPGPAGQELIPVKLEAPGENAGAKR